jgi:phosphate transport system permease protein
VSEPTTTTPERRVLGGGPVSRGDKWFFRTTSIAANFAFVLVGLILLFLFISAWPALQANGIAFVFGNKWDPTAAKPVMQLGPMLWGTFVVSLLGLVIATPMAIAAAYLIEFFLPQRLSKVATTVLDLLAAIPSVIIGLWGLYVFTPVVGQWGTILNNLFGWIPLFHMSEKGSPALYSPWVGGWVLGIMIVPIIASVSREIFSQLDPALINGALALGGSRSSVLFRVILPTAAPGVVGGMLLGLGRAIGETVAILFVLQLSMKINWYEILEPRGGDVASWIMAKFGEADTTELQGLIAAGLVLFVATLLVNTLANIIVSRSKAVSR